MFIRSLLYSTLSVMGRAGGLAEASFSVMGPTGQQHSFTGPHSSIATSMDGNGIHICFVLFATPRGGDEIASRVSVLKKEKKSVLLRGATTTAAPGRSRHVLTGDETSAWRPGLRRRSRITATREDDPPFLFLLH